MLAFRYGQADLAEELLGLGASIRLSDKSNLTAFDYLLANFIMNKDRRQQFYINDSALLKYWDRVRPTDISYEFGQRQFHIGSHSMLFFIIFLMRNASGIRLYNPSLSPGEMPNDAGGFSIEALLIFAEMFPDEILSPYRKKRSYINSVMAFHEVSKESPHGKATFMRVRRGFYKLNPDIVFC